MVNDAIILEPTQSAATECRELIDYIDSLRRTYELGVRIRAKMQHRFSDAGGENAINWAALQTLWGIPANGENVGPTANGAIIYTYMNGSVGAMEGTFQNNAGKEFPERVMG